MQFFSLSLEFGETYDSIKNLQIWYEKVDKWIDMIRKRKQEWKTKPIEKSYNKLDFPSHWHWELEEREAEDSWSIFK